MNHKNLPYIGNENLFEYLRWNSYRSERYKLFYIATPKVACTTLKWWFAALEGYSKVIRSATDSTESDPDLIIHDTFHKVAPNITGLLPKSLLEVLSADSYFRFAVVRNPYKRIFSAWQSKLLLQEPLQIGPYVTCDFFNKKIENSDDVAESFEGFLEHLATQETPTYWDHHWTPQAALLRPDLINYSQLVQIEQVDELSKALADRLGAYIPDPFSVRRTNESLIPYLPELLTARSSELIRTLYAEDFDKFGYDKQPPKPKETFSADQFDVALQAIKIIRGRHRRLGEYVRHTSSLNQTVAERDGQITLLNQTVAERDGQLGSVRQSLETHLQTHVEAQRLRQERVEEAKKIIRGRHRRLSEHVRHTSSLNQTVAERDGQIALLNQTVAERDGQLGSVRQSLETHLQAHGEVQQLRQERVEEAKKIAELSVQATELQILRNSRLWRLRDAIRLEPWSIGKTVRIARLSLSLATPAPLRRRIPAILRRNSTAVTLQPTSAAAEINADFDAEFYVQIYPDVAAAGVDPYSHYLENGKSEGRIGKLPRIPGMETLTHLDTHRETVLVVCHEGSRTGAPILGYNLVRELLPKFNVVTLFLGPGPVLEACRALGAIVLGPTIHHRHSIIADQTIAAILEQTPLRFALINSVEARFPLASLARRHVPTVSLLHEFAAYTRPHGAFLETVRWSGTTVFSSRLTRDDAWASHRELQEIAFPVISQGRCVLPGTSAAESAPSEPSSVVRPADFPADGLVVLGLGSVQLRKGVDLFLKCAARVCRSAPDLPIHFV